MTRPHVPAPTPPLSKWTVFPCELKLTLVPPSCFCQWILITATGNETKISYLPLRHLLYICFSYLKTPFSGFSCCFSWSVMPALTISTVEPNWKDGNGFFLSSSLSLPSSLPPPSLPPFLPSSSSSSFAVELYVHPLLLRVWFIPIFPTLLERLTKVLVDRCLKEVGTLCFGWLSILFGDERIRSFIEENGMQDVCLSSPAFT